MDMNSRIINARTAARRADPACAGYDDGIEMGSRVNPSKGKVKVGDWADPRWSKNRDYRKYFRAGFLEGRRLLMELPATVRHHQWGSSGV